MIEPVSILTATYLAKQWISASAQSYRSSAFLPSTPQYLLAVGNLGIPGFRSLVKSAAYLLRRRNNTSPVFTHSTFTLAGLCLAALLIVIGDIWLHVSSASVSESNIAHLNSLHNFSRDFAPPDDSTDGPWRLQHGLQTFLGINGVSTVTQLNNTMAIVPVGLPLNSTVVASTVGMDLNCELVSSECTFNQQTNPITFDCTNVQPGAKGSLGAVNITLFPSGNTTSLSLLATMALPSLFNQSTTVVAAQIFQCVGSLQNITYISSNNGVNITNSVAIDNLPLQSMWNLSQFPGKQQLIETALGAVGTSTIYVQGMNVSSMPTIFSNGLSRLFTAFLAGETVPTPSIAVLSLLTWI